MHRLLLSLLAAFAMALPLYAQDDESDNAETDETSVEEPVDDSDLDEQGYATENEDDFEASQDVAADQSVAFPVDI